MGRRSPDFRPCLLKTKMPEEKKRQVHILALRLSIITFLIFSILILPVPKAKAFNPNAIGVQAGGIITTLVPGYAWSLGPYYFGYCQTHVLITIKSPPFLIGEIGIILPPAIPRAFYNYGIPGLAYIGAYYPIPINQLPGIGCPYDPVPVYFGTEFGTSLCPVGSTPTKTKDANGKTVIKCVKK